MCTFIVLRVDARETDDTDALLAIVAAPIELGLE